VPIIGGLMASVNVVAPTKAGAQETVTAIIHQVPGAVSD